VNNWMKALFHQENMKHWLAIASTGLTHFQLSFIDWRNRTFSSRYYDGTLMKSFLLSWFSWWPWSFSL
jgi:hypothetical protein